MNQYRQNVLIAIQLCSFALLAFFVAATATAQNSAVAPPSKDKGGGPPLFAVEHDETLQGDGSSGSPLGIKASPTVSGSLTVGGDIKTNAIVSQSSTVSNLLDANFIDATAITVDARGTSILSAIRSIATDGSLGVEAIGGLGLDTRPGGTGVVSKGGQSDNGNGGEALSAEGGMGFNGGNGVRALGGVSNRSPGAGGIGLIAVGGRSIPADVNGRFGGNGGAGVTVNGGTGFGNGNVGGAGIIVSAGEGVLGASNGPAGVFFGDVAISGKLVKGSGSFKIDHPLDPENRYLSHSFVESPDMMNIYNGNITTDANGDAFVQLPEYFEALNRDFRYQLTVIGTFAQSIVAEKINGNHFRIKTNLPNVEVSWQATGVRQDAYANKNRISVEEDKTATERGFYLHPDAFDQPREKSILMVQHAEMISHADDSPEKARTQRTQ